MVQRGVCRNDLVPEQDSNKAQTEGSRNQSKAADSRVSKAGSPLPRQHPSAQFVHIPAHTSLSFGLPHHPSCKPDEEQP